MGFNAFNDLQFEEADTCILFQYADFSFCDPRYDHGMSGQDIQRNNAYFAPLNQKWKTYLYTYSALSMIRFLSGKADQVLLSISIALVVSII